MILWFYSYKIIHTLISRDVYTKARSLDYENNLSMLTSRTSEDFEAYDNGLQLTSLEFLPVPHNNQ